MGIKSSVSAGCLNACERPSGIAPTQGNKCQIATLVQKPQPVIPTADRVKARVTELRVTYMIVSVNLGKFHIARQTQTKPQGCWVEFRLSLAESGVVTCKCIAGRGKENKLTQPELLMGTRPPF